MRRPLLMECRDLLRQASADLASAIKYADRAIEDLNLIKDRSKKFWEKYHQIENQISRS